MHQKGFSSNYIFLILATVVLIGGIYFTQDLKSSIKNLVTSKQKDATTQKSPPVPVVTKTVIPEAISCNKDEDCGLNICKCTAMNKNFIETKDQACTRVCEGTPRCINNKCELVKKDDQCLSLGESSCIKSPNCRTIYNQVGPNRDAVGMPLDNFKFASCLSLSQEEIDWINQESNKCTEVGGVWTKTKGNPAGICVE